MKSSTNRLCLTIFASIIFSPLGLRAATPTVDVLSRLGGDSNGFHPQSALIDGHDGFFYGTTEAGGPANLGTIFKVTPDGTVTTIYRFTGGSDGSNPTTALVSGGDGNFYGVTPGDYPLTNYNPLTGKNPGTIFRVTPTGVLITVHRFSAFDASNHNTDGGYPRAELILGRDGNLYGTTSHGGPTDGGTVFRMALDGSGFTTLTTFDGTIKVNGERDTGPDAALVEAPDGNFYGTTHLGGSAEAAGGQGRIFRLTPAGEVTTLFSFELYVSGTYPTNALTVGTDGNLYGTLSGNNTTDPQIFRVTLAGVYTPFGTGSVVTAGSALSALILGTDGNFYGTASNASMVFRFTPSGTFTNIFQFPGTPGDDQTHQYFPNGLVQGGDGNFYGTTRYGGYGGLTAGAGTVFRVSPTGTEQLIHLFTMGGTGGGQGRLLELPGGTFLGATSAGGVEGVGTLFAATPAGAVSTIHSFHFPTEGGYPAGGVVQDPAGGLYCATNSGGSADAAGSLPYPYQNATLGQGGTFARIIGLSEADLQQAVQLQVLHSFDLATGSGPGSSPLPLSGTPAVFYGTTTTGGTHNDGTVYSLSASGAYTVLHHFGDQANDGSYPVAGLVAGNDSNFYGATEYGGMPVQIDPLFEPGYTQAYGTLFSVTPTGAVTTLHSFQTDNGGTYPAGNGLYPTRDLVLGKDGNFYGTTSNTTIDYHGYYPQGNGVIFFITPAGQYKTLHVFADDGSEGSGPSALVQASDGTFYGTTNASGYPFSSLTLNTYGTVFSITPDGTFTVLYGFPEFSAVGYSPAGPLVQSKDGNLYGTTSLGGTDDAGVFYRVTLVAPAVTSAGTATGQVGVAFAYQIAASNGPTSFAATGLPAGLGVDASTGLISGNPTTSGTFAVMVSATNGIGTGSATLTLTIAGPTVTLTSTVPEVVVNSGQNGEFLLTLSDASTVDLQVAYTVKGSATPGVDYVMLKGTAKVKAGKTSKIIKIVPEGNLGGASKKTVKLVLEPGIAYTVGTTGKIKVTILPATP